MLPRDLQASLRPYRQHALLGAVIQGTAVAFAGVGLGFSVATWLPQVGVAAAVLMLVGVLGGAVWAVTSFIRTVGVPKRLAQQVEMLLPELGDSVRAAVGLAADGNRQGMSLTLAHAAVQDTTFRLRTMTLRQHHLRRVLRAARPWMGALLAGALLVVTPAALARQKLLTGLVHAWTWNKAGLAGRSGALPPLWSDVTVTFSYPAYMKRAPQTLEGVSGDLSAPKGAEVVIRARADRAIKSAKLLFVTGEVPLSVTPPRQLEGHFTVGQAGRYRVSLTDVHGDEVVEEEGHLLTVEPDNVPGVELLDPAQDTTVQSNERIALAWHARDDFGITEFAVLVRNLRKGGEPTRKVVASFKDEPKDQNGHSNLDVAALDVRPGDRLVVTLEARDNDTVSGPKAGLSAARMIKVFSAAEHHDELIAKQQELMKRMVVQLADEMETPLSIPAEGSDVLPDVEAERWLAQVKRGQGLGESLSALADEFAKDDLAPMEVTRALRNIKTDLAKSYDEMAVLASEMVNQVRQTQRFPEPYAARSKRLGHAVIARLETHILYMEDLLGKQRLKEAQDAAKELASTQAHLKDLLEQFKKAGDEETRKKIMEEMNALREQLRELSEKLAKLQREVPQEYMNMEAMEKNNLQDPMADIDRMLAEGDVEGAAKALDKMAQQTRDLMDEMQKGEKDYGGDEYAELREKLQNFATEMDEVTSTQEQLLQDNKSRLDRAREKARKELGEDADQFAQKLQKEAEEVQQQLKNMGTQGLMELESEQREEAESRASETSRALKAKDFEEAQKSVRGLSQALEWMRSSLQDRMEGRFATNSKEAKKARDKVEQALPRARHLQEELDRLMPDPAQHLSAEDREAMRDSAKRQGKLGERARQLGQEMENLSKELPLFSQEHKDLLDGARRDMQGAQADLGSQDLPGGAGRQRDALGKLQQLKKAMSEMGQNAQGGGPGGVPLPFADSGDSGTREGRGKSNKEKVEIPNADAFKVPAQFRKDILDAMKEAPPNKFSGEVKQYYEELVK